MDANTLYEQTMQNYSYNKNTRALTDEEKAKVRIACEKIASEVKSDSAYHYLAHTRNYIYVKILNLPPFPLKP